MRVLSAAIVFLALAGCAPAGQPSSTLTTNDAFAVELFADPRPVDDFTLQTLDGRTLRAQDLRGKVVMINFWATWCGPCRAEIPMLVELQERYRDHLVIIGVSEDEGPVESVQRFAEEHKVNYPVAMTTPEMQRIFPGVVALPTTFMLDRELRVAQRHVGLLDAERTERETLVLAGLAPNAQVARIEPDKPVGLANAAQAKEIPGVDLSNFTPERRVAVLQRLNTDGCNCGCGLTIARCRIEDPACGVSLPIARRIVAEMGGADVQQP